MKIWVCRDTVNTCDDENYVLFLSGCKPKRAGNQHYKWWECACQDEEGRCYGLHYIKNDLCSNMFKDLTGIKRHLKPGTKKLMTWTLPLARQPKGRK